MRCDYCQCAACAKISKCKRKKCKHCGGIIDRIWSNDEKKQCKGFNPNPIYFVHKVMESRIGTEKEYEYVLIKILQEPLGLLPELIPKPGTYFIAMLGKMPDISTYKKADRPVEWCIISYKGRKLCLRNSMINGKEFKVIRTIERS